MRAFFTSATGVCIRPRKPVLPGYTGGVARIARFGDYPQQSVRRKRERSPPCTTWNLRVAVARLVRDGYFEPDVSCWNRRFLCNLGCCPPKNRHWLGFVKKDRRRPGSDVMIGCSMLLTNDIVRLRQWPVRRFRPEPIESESKRSGDGRRQRIRSFLMHSTRAMQPVRNEPWIAAR